jgi:hypothetical protein
MNRMKRIVLPSVLALASACGQVQEPMSAIAPEGAATLTLNAPVASAATLIQGFTAGAPFFTVNVGATAAVLAPAAGIVSDVAADGAGGFSVTIYHSFRLSSQLSGLAAANLRRGDYVASGTPVGTTPITGQFRFGVIRDGLVVCPLLEMSAAGRTSLSLAAQPGGGCQ